MKKKITKLIESSLPRLYNEDGEIINRREIANKIYDSIPNVEKLDIEPFETWIPLICSGCYFNEAYKFGCSYDMLSERVHQENSVPDNCPKGYSN